MLGDSPLDSDDQVEKMIDYLQKGGTVQDVYQISNKDMEVMFLACSRYLHRRQFEEAADSFLFMTFLNPYMSKYWMGLGEGLRLSQQFDKAVEAYLLASIMDFEDPRPYFHAGSCYLALDDPRAALDRFLLVLEYSHGMTEYASLRETCHELVDDLTHRITEVEE